MVGVYVASYNTRDLTGRCVESILERTAGSYELTVGDSASADGSLELLRGYELRGLIRLQVETERRSHAWWLDRWTAECPFEYAVFVDSDVVVRRRRWLARLVRAAERAEAALVGGEFCREQAGFVEPVAGVTVRLAARPCPWLLLTRPAALRDLGCSWEFAKRETDAVPEGLVAYDVGARLFETAQERGLRWRVMPPWYRLLDYAHRAGSSWR